MRDLILDILRKQFDEGVKTGDVSLTTPDEDDITDFEAEVVSLGDQELLDLYTWTVSFQG